MQDDPDAPVFNDLNNISEVPDSSDRRLLREHFLEIEKLIGRQFDFDAFADDSGCNAQTLAFCCPAQSFFSTDVAGRTVWINPPFTQQCLSQAIQHYLNCKMSDPAHTSACILVPKWDGPFRESLPTLRLIKEFPQGTVLFDQPVAGSKSGERHVMPGIPWPVQVYYDAPRIQCSTSHANDALIMTFDIKLAGACAVSLLDTGAKASFLSQEFVQLHAVPTYPCQVTEVRLADGSVTEVSRKCKVPVNMRNHASVVDAYVLPAIVPGIDIIQGEDWMSEHGAELRYSARPQVRLKMAESFLTVKSRWDCCAPLPSSEHTLAYVTDRIYAASTCDFLSAKQAKKLLDKGARHFLMLVKTDDPTSSELRGGTMTSGQTSVCATTVRDQAEIDGLVSAQKISELKLKYGRIFQPLPQHLPPDRGVGHTIPLIEGSVPPYKRQYRLSPVETAEVKRQVADFLAKGYIEPSTSPYGAPVLFVDKPDGSLRMVIDYRLLNRITIKNRYPLPRIEDLFDKLAGATVFSSLDLASGYYQIRITEEDRPKTAFCTPIGLFQFRVLCLGLSNSPSTFQSVMNKVFAPYIGKFMQVYLDDLIVYSKTAAEHAEHLEIVFKVLQEHEFYANPVKCTFNQAEVKYLGHIVGRDGLKVDPKKIAVIKDWPVPLDVSQLRSFLGIGNYFRKFIQGYSSMVACLTQLTHQEYENIPLPQLWKDIHQHAFESVKLALTTAPVLALPDFTQPFELISDASLNGTGAVLVQNGRPVAYTSAKFSSAERNYTTGEQELLGVFHALTEWRCYLEGGEGTLTLVTDHNPLVYLQSQANLSRKQARWMEFFSRFHYEWVYRPGRVNVADPISRNPALCKLYTVLMFAAYNLRGEAPQIPDAPLTQRILDGYQYDQWFSDPKHTQSLAKNRKGFWLKGSQVVVPNCSEIKRMIFRQMHDSVTAGHPGISRTFELVSRLFWWPSMLLDITDYVRACPSCQRNKASNKPASGTMHPLPIPESRWESVSVDFIVQLPRTSHGHDAVAVCVDRLSKMAHFIPCTTNLTAAQFADLFVDSVIRLHGVPKDIVSDRDSKFTSMFWSQVCKRMDIQQCMSTAYHPQSDGQTERMNRVLQEMLRHYVGSHHADWDKYLSMAEFAVNNSFNQSIQNTPFFLNYGQHPHVPVINNPSDVVPAAVQFTEALQQALSRAKASLAKAQDRQKHYYDKHRQDVVFSVGQQVLLNTKNIRPEAGTVKKLLPRWIGPFLVADIIGQNAVRLQLPVTWKIHNVFHVQLVKPYKGDGTVQPPPPVDWLGNEPLFTVERLLDHRIKKISRRKVTEFLVKWQGYSAEHDSWEPESNLLTCDQLIKDYWQSIGQPQFTVPSRKRKVLPAATPLRHSSRLKSHSEDAVS